MCIVYSDIAPRVLSLRVRISIQETGQNHFGRLKQPPFFGLQMTAKRYHFKVSFVVILKWPNIYGF
jgi:hypothetical protein